MIWLRQADVGRCEFIDVLEEAAVRGGPVALRLADGTEVEARVLDVVTREGGDFAVLDGGRELEVGTLEAMTRAGA